MTGLAMILRQQELNQAEARRSSKVIEEHKKNTYGKSREEIIGGDLIRH